MHVDLSSIQARIIVALTVLWLVLTVAIGLGMSSDRYMDAGEIAVAMLIVSAPVWLFWGLAWVFKWNIPFRRSPGRAWVTVSPEEAKKHPLYGAGGAVKFLGIVQPLGAIAIFVQFFLASPGPGQFPEVSNFALGWYGELVLNFAFVGLIFYQSWLIFKENPLFPKVFFWTVAAAFGLPYIDALWVSMIFKISFSEVLEGVGQGELANAFGRSLGALLLWGTYVTISRRVNITYRHRVRQRDLSLVRQNPAIAEPAATE